MTRPKKSTNKYYLISSNAFEKRNYVEYIPYKVIFIFGSVGTPRNALIISSGGSSHEPRGIPRFPLVFLTNYLRNFHVIRQR